MALPMTVTSINAKLKYLSSGSETIVDNLGSGRKATLAANGAIFGRESQPLQVGGRIQFRWTGRLFCTSCNGLTSKLFTGYCWSCFNSKAEADACVLNPFQCHYLSGSCREPSWGLGFCYQPHVLYLSYTGAFKVGITRLNQVPVRWLDQGATFAVPLAITGSRHQAGALEKALGSKFSDKTVWQKMLAAGNSLPTNDEVTEALTTVRSMRDNNGPLDSLNARVSAPPRATAAGQIQWIESPVQVEIHYAGAAPVLSPKTLPMERETTHEGTFLGFKGQYLILDSGVFNVRRHEGYEIEYEIFNPNTTQN
jgi:hypothetical protein